MVTPDQRLDSWKEIAAYLKRGERTVRRWEQTEGLPVHRHTHEKRGTVYAFKPELDAWWAERTTTAEAPPIAVQPSTARRMPWAMLIAAGIFTAGAVTFVAFRGSGTANAPMRAGPLTSYSGDEFQPSFSPDGSQIVFSRKEGTGGPSRYVKLMGPGEPMRLTNQSSTGFSPAWSPDGRTVAFLRAGENGATEILTIPALGGPERRIGDSHGFVSSPFFSGAQLVWSPDGRLLLISDAPGEKHGLFLLSIESGQKTRLTTVPGPQSRDRGPAFSPEVALLPS